ncbi:hypothetical protein HDU89_007794 [Geranomyces variabilis]|nr:hypothetical protein HDU89_007794 [Geranomyces variabilis]
MSFSFTVVPGTTAVVVFLASTARSVTIAAAPILASTEHDVVVTGQTPAGAPSSQPWTEPSVTIAAAPAPAPMELDVVVTDQTRPEHTWAETVPNAIATSAAAHSAAAASDEEEEEEEDEDEAGRRTAEEEAEEGEARQKRWW